jgi:transposase
MSLDAHAEPDAIQTHIGAIFISLELSRSKWLITSLVPGGGQRMSRHSVEAGDLAGLLARFWAIRDKASGRTGIRYPIIVIQEAGLDGLWIHRALEQDGIESHVVDAASIAVSRRRRRAKTDRIDREALLRVLLAFKRGEPRVCSMSRAPTPRDEDRRRICRERKTLLAERIRHVNRIKGLLFSQGIGLRAAAPGSTAGAGGGSHGRRARAGGRTSKRKSGASWIGSNCCSARSRRGRPNATRCWRGRPRSRRLRTQSARPPRSRC